jgi:hypothetical protein
MKKTLASTWVFILAVQSLGYASAPLNDISDRVGVFGNLGYSGDTSGKDNQDFNQGLVGKR